MATKQIAWNTGGGNIILTYQGQGNGTIVVSSDDNKGVARSQVITVETLDGVKSVNLTVSQAACPVPVGTVLNYAYTGSYQEVELPAGEYKLQCWGAQGGSNGTNSTYGITAKAGGKGGYSEGTIILTQKTTLRVYVGGQGSASAGGFNGGGSTTGTAQYNSGNELGYSKMGGGGGATDIRLSDGALLSRMIVAGGGGGGAMCFKAVTTSQDVETFVDSYTLPYKATYSGVPYYWDEDVNKNSGLQFGKRYKFYTSLTATIKDKLFVDGVWVKEDGTVVSNKYRASTDYIPINSSTDVLRMELSSGGSGLNYLYVVYYNSSKTYVAYSDFDDNTGECYHQPSEYNASYVRFVRYASADYGTVTPPRPYTQKTTAPSGQIQWDTRNASYSEGQVGTVNLGQEVTINKLQSSEVYIGFVFKGSTSSYGTVGINVYEVTTQTSTTTETAGQVGYVGGGTSGGGYSTTYQGKQNAAGSGGSFGQGANQTATNYRYCSGAGGGGWYGGGGGSYSDSSMTYCKYSGGGSGFVNTASSASYRPSGYTGIELDSGTTYDGSQTFIAPSGSNETGHTGNGYARITRLA